MKYFDLSQPLFDQCPNCPAHPAPKVELVSRHPGDGWQMELLTIASHTGTHLDAPLHKMAGGKSIDSLALEQFAGLPRVADFTHLPPGSAIDANDLSERLTGNLLETIVLLNTGWGLRRERTDEWLHHSPYLSPDGATWLARRGIKGVGIDHFSIGGTREPGNAQTHEILLGAGIWIVEELRFGAGWESALKDAVFQALPIYLRGGSGAPCRAVLVQTEGRAR